MSGDRDPGESVTVTRNADGTENRSKVMTGRGTCYAAAIPVTAFGAGAIDTGDLIAMDGGAVFIAAIHHLGKTERRMVLALGGSNAMMAWIGSVDEAEIIVRQLQFHIGRARALMAGGGTA